MVNLLLVLSAVVATLSAFYAVQDYWNKELANDSASHESDLQLLDRFTEFTLGSPVRSTGFAR